MVKDILKFGITEIEKINFIKCSYSFKGMLMMRKY